MAQQGPRFFVACGMLMLICLFQPTVCQSSVLSLTPLHTVVEYRISDVAFSGVSCEGYFLAGQSVDIMLPYDLTLTGDASTDELGDIAVAAYVTDVTVDVCAHGIYVDHDHCTDPFVVDRNERFFRARDWDVEDLRLNGKVRVELPVRLQSCHSTISAIVINQDGDILNSSKAVSANAHFYVEIDYPKYMEYLAQHERQASPVAQQPNVSLKRVISFSVYGTKLRYLVGAIKNAILALRYFPSFEVWFYVGASVPDWTRSSLELFSHVKVIRMQSPEDHTAKLWRFHAFSSPEVELVLVRDVDSRLNARDAASVNDFLSSGLDFHITVDHVGHKNFLITACCFAGKASALRDMSQKLLSFRGGNYHWNDQDFLALSVYPDVARSILVHSSVHSPQLLAPSRVAPFPFEKKSALDWVAVAVDAEDRFVFKFDSNDALRATNATKYVWHD